MTTVKHIQVELFKLYRRRATKICLAGVLFWTAFGLILMTLVLSKQYVSARISGNEFSIIQSDYAEMLRVGYAYSRTPSHTSYGGEWLPYLIYGMDNDLMRSVADAIMIACLASMLDLGRFRGMVRLLLGHGLHRSKYVLVQGLTLLIYLLGLWAIMVLVEALLSQIFLLGYGSPGWQSAYWGDFARVVGGNALRHFVMAGAIYLTVVVFHSPIFGALGGFVYRFYLQDEIFSLLKNSAWPQWTHYTTKFAGEALLDPTLPLSGGEVAPLWLVLFAWGAAFFALATWLFEKRDFT